MTFCGVSQLAGVKVSMEVTVASPSSEEVMLSTTFEDGCAFNTTVKMSVEPASVTPVEPLVSAIVNPATSSSVVVTETVWSPTASKSSSDAASRTETVTVVFCVPSIM